MSTANGSPLDKLLATRKRPSYLLGPLERFLILNPEEQHRATDVLHPSEISSPKWCIRASWHLLRGADAPKQTHNLRTQSIFAEGHAIHDKWQHWLTRMNVLRGAWHCAEHGDWWGLRTDSCQECLHVVYREVPILHEEYVISGKADGWLVVDGQDDAVLEVKSIGIGTIRAYGGKISSKGLAASFKEITEPFDGHVRQASMYLFCLKWMHENGYITEAPPEQILYLYECKENQEAKEFLVPYDEEVLEGTIEHLEELAAAGDEPPRCTGIRDFGSDLCPLCEVYE